MSFDTTYPRGRHIRPTSPQRAIHKMTLWVEVPIDWDGDDAAGEAFAILALSEEKALVPMEITTGVLVSAWNGYSLAMPPDPRLRKVVDDGQGPHPFDDRYCSKRCIVVSMLRR